MAPQKQSTWLDELWDESFDFSKYISTVSDFSLEISEMEILWNNGVASPIQGFYQTSPCFENIKEDLESSTWLSLEYLLEC